MKSIVTQKDLAQATGLDQSTISLALRGDPRVNEKTRELVLKTARRLGYRKDPMLTALATYRRGLKEASFHGTLAWIHDPTVEKLPYFDDSVYVHYYNGAKNQAIQHGYKLEKFILPTKLKEHQRLSDVLFHRGIEGVLLPPQLNPGPAPKLEWKQFSAVTFGWSVTAPRFHALSPNHYHNAIEVVRNLRTMGYQRIGGCVGWDDAEFFNFHLWAHGIEMSTAYMAQKIPVFRITRADKDHAERFKTWYKAHRPDAIAVNIEHIGFVAELLATMGVYCPEDVGLALLYRASQETHYAGIFENSPYLGEAAVDLLVGTLRRREFGAPSIRRMMQVEGTWKSGSSLRVQN